MFGTPLHARVSNPNLLGHPPVIKSICVYATQGPKNTNTKINCVVPRYLPALSASLKGRLTEKTYITRNSPQKDHGHHHTEENNNDKGVDETKPVYPRVEYVEVIVPTSSLLDIES